MLEEAQRALQRFEHLAEFSSEEKEVLKLSVPNWANPQFTKLQEHAVGIGRDDADDLIWTHDGKPELLKCSQEEWQRQILNQARQIAGQFFAVKYF